MRTALNVSIMLIASAIAMTCLYVVAHSETWWLWVLCAYGFAYTGNTLFAMLHEAVHNCASQRSLCNDLIGNFCAPFFPCSFTAQRHFHLGHHNRNRSDLESWDYFLPDDNRILKRVQWYSILCGWYWTAAPAFCFLFLVAAPILRLSCIRSSHPAIQRMGIGPMLDGLDHHGRIRLETILALCVQLALFYFLELNLMAYLICYGSFAWMWSSLQYANHAFTVRDKIDGAWNLRVLPWTRLFFLNYHHHLAHHQHPEAPWYRLPHLVDRSIARPLFWSIYGQMLRAPREPPLDE